MRIGIDLGGTKTEAVLMDASGRIVARTRIETPRSYPGTIDAIEQLVRDLERGASAPCSVGIGIPGALVPDTHRVKNANSVWLIGQPLGHDLEARLQRRVRVMNDANCFALSEAADGAGAGASVVFGVILGTGVGGGIVIDGRCVEGANMIAGEWGHNPLPWPHHDELPGPPCYCGRSGCIETFLSGPGFERDFLQRTSRLLTSREIVAAADAGDGDALAALARYHDRLARALASVVNVLDPHVIVLGGGMSNLPALAPTTASLLPRYAFSDTIVTRIAPNVHGDSSGVRGAAWLWPA